MAWILVVSAIVRPIVATVALHRDLLWTGHRRWHWRSWRHVRWARGHAMSVRIAESWRRRAVSWSL